jgi:sugar/nucleoside kinase (ribokinase family)
MHPRLGKVTIMIVKQGKRKRTFEENNGYMTVPPPPLFAVSIVSPETK